MKRLAYLHICAIVVSCNNQGPEYVKIVPAPVHQFTGNYLLFDSSYTITNSTASPTTTTTNYSYNKPVIIFMDSTARYITVNADTFRWNETYVDYKGYYSYFLSPVDNNMIVLTPDSVKLYTNRQLVNHSLATGLCIGYHKP